MKMDHTGNTIGFRKGDIDKETAHEGRSPEKSLEAKADGITRAVRTGRWRGTAETAARSGALDVTIAWSIKNLTKSCKISRALYPITSENIES